MSWLDILQLVTTLMQQALMAFAQGHKKESPATVNLAEQHVATLQKLVEQAK